MNTPGLPIEADSLTATQAKNEFGRILEKVIRGGRVVITSHGSPKAILISIDEFNSLSRTAGRRLNALSEDFDAMLAQMQTPKARKG